MQTTQLKTNQLGQTGLEITRVGFGAWAIGGGGWEFGWGSQQDDQSIAAIQHALELKEQGLVRHIGVSNFDVDQLRRIGQIAPVETIQPQYSLIERDIEQEILPFTKQEGIGVIVYSPMGSGLLTGAMSRERIAGFPDDDWRKHDDRFREPELSRNLDLVERIGVVADRHDTVPGAVAIAWTLRNPAVDGAIVGFRSPEQVNPLIDAASLELSQQDITTIEKEQ